MSNLTSDELYDLAFRSMGNLIGFGEDRNTSPGALQDLAYGALIVFRDAVDAALCAKRGLYGSPASGAIPNERENRNAAEHLAHAAEQLALLPPALMNAKERLISAQHRTIQAH